MKKYFIFTFLIFLFVTINVKAEIVVKNGISVDLIEHTYFCENICYSKYKVCNSGEKINDINFKFLNDKSEQKTLQYDLDYDLIEDENKCRIVEIIGYKGIYEDIDNVLCFNDVCFNEFEWWNRSYRCREKINFTYAINNGELFSVNDTYGLNNEFFWTLKVPEDMFTYFKTIDCLGNKAIGNETDILKHENSSSRSGYSSELMFNESGLHGYWHFDEVDGTVAYDSTEYSNDGTFFSNPVHNDYCIFGKCLDFQVSDNDYVRVLDSSSVRLSNNMSVMAWFKSIYAGGQQSILSKEMETGNNYPSYGLSLRTDTKVGFYVSLDGTTYKSVISDPLNSKNGNWHHVTGTYNGSHLKIYYDGKLNKTSTIYTNGIGYTNEPLNLGKWRDGGGDYFNGSLDEIRIYNKELTEIEIKNIYENGKNRTEMLEPEFYNINVSIFSNRFNLNDTTISGTSQITIANITYYNPLDETTVGFLFTNNCEKNSGAGTSIVRSQFIFDGEIKNASEFICAVTDIGTITSNGRIYGIDNVSSGYHNVVLQLNISSGSVDITNNELIFFVGSVSNDLQLSIGNRTIKETNFNSLNYVQVMNITIPKIVKSTFSHVGFFYANSTGTETVYLYIENLDTGIKSALQTRYLSSSLSIGTMGIGWIDNSIYDINPANYSIYAKTKTGKNVTLLVEMIHIPSNDFIGNRYNAFYNSNINTNLTHSIPLSSGIHLISNVTTELLNGTNVTIVSTATFNSTSGKHTPRIFINTTNQNLCSQKYRSLTDSLNQDHASVILVSICNNLTIGTNITFYEWIEIETGESINLIDESIAGIESVELEIIIENIAPIPTTITNPLNNSLVYGTNENITWIPFFDPNNDIVNYNISLYKNGTFNRSIDDFTFLNIVYINYEIIPKDTYDIVVIGCDPFGLCSNVTSTITIIESLEPTLLNATINFNFDMSNSQFIGECINDNVLMRKWNKTSCIEDINECLTAYEYEYLNCPYGCIEQVGQYGDDCNYPSWEIYIFITIAVIIIIILALYFERRK